MSIGSLLGVLGAGNAANQALEVAAQQQQQQQSLQLGLLGGISGGILGGSMMGSGGGGMMSILPLLSMLPMLLMLLEQLQQGPQGRQGYPGQGYSGQSYPQCPPNYGNGGTISQQQQGNGNVTTFTDHNGWKVTVNPNNGNGWPTVTMTSPDGKHTITESGDPHESGAQGAESDWSAKDRTIELPDGTVVNINAASANGAIQGVNIFDGQEEANINAQDGSVNNVDYNGYKTARDESRLPTDNIARVGWQNGQFSLIPEQQEFNPYSQIPGYGNGGPASSDAYAVPAVEVTPQQLQARQEILDASQSLTPNDTVLLQNIQRQVTQQYGTGPSQQKAFAMTSELYDAYQSGNFTDGQFVKGSVDYYEALYPEQQ